MSARVALAGGWACGEVEQVDRHDEDEVDEEEERGLPHRPPPVQLGVVGGEHLPRADVTRDSPSVEDARRERRRELAARDAGPGPGPFEVHSGCVRRLVEGVQEEDELDSGEEGDHPAGERVRAHQRQGRGHRAWQGARLVLDALDGGQGCGYESAQGIASREGDSYTMSRVITEISVNTMQRLRQAQR
eukprot:scaffold32967_cov64-Phaeocystis_antarctica.AAC.1